MDSSRFRLKQARHSLVSVLRFAGSVLLCPFSEAEATLARQISSGTWAKKEYFSCSESSNNRIMLDFHLSITHLFIFTLLLPFIIQFDPNKGCQMQLLCWLMANPNEPGIFPSTFLRFSLSYWHLLCFNVKFMGLFLVIQFSKFFQTGIDGGSAWVLLRPEHWEKARGLAALVTLC